MTVSELIAALAEYDGNLPVCTIWPHGVREVEQDMFKVANGSYWPQGGCHPGEGDGEFLFLDWGVKMEDRHGG